MAFLQVFGDGWGHMGGVGWLGMLVVWLIGLALVAAVVIALVRSSRSNPPPSRPGLDELDARYARGEIDDEEYLRRRALLLGERPSGG